MRTACRPLCAVFALVELTIAARADDLDLAKQRANPLAALATLPIQQNFDCCFGPERVRRSQTTFLPVVPFRLNNDWDLITRTVTSITAIGATTATGKSHFGLGDTAQQFFLTPHTITNGLTVGVGPGFLWPTATDGALGAKKWGAGPAITVVKQAGPWTFAVLSQQTWSYAGVYDRTRVNQTYIQPGMSYTFKDTTALGFGSEMTYDWVSHQWIVPLIGAIGHIYRFGDQPVSLGAQVKYFPVTPVDGPRWGIRLNATLLFPR